MRLLSGILLSIGFASFFVYLSVHAIKLDSVELLDEKCESMELIIKKMLYFQDNKQKFDIAAQELDNFCIKNFLYDSGIFFKKVAKKLKLKKSMIKKFQKMCFFNETGVFVYDAKYQHAWALFFNYLIDN